MSGRSFELALETPWAMTEDYLRLLISIAGRQLEADIELDVPDHLDPESVAVQTGEMVEDARRATVRGNVAIVPVVGPIFRRANLFTDMSGATSVELLARDFRAALEDPSVEAILLDIDSPGGEVNGISEMSDLIFEAREQMPIRAFVGGAGASGAYWLASSAREVVTADTALLGSIGVRTAFVDTSERDRQRGIQRIEFVSSQSPNKVPDPTEENGRAQIQRVVDELAEIFIQAVARNRNVTRETVVTEFGGGAVFVGSNAVRRGLADRVGTFEGVLSEMQDETASSGVQGGLAADTGLEETMSDSAEGQDERTLEEKNLTAKEVREAFPEASAEIEAEAREAERERIQAIHDLDVPNAYGELVVEGMFEPDSTAESVSRAVVEAQSQKRKAQRDALQGDEEELDAPEARSGAGDEELDGPEQAAAFILQAGRRPDEARTA